MSNFYIADWHYNHKNCLAFDNRPFTSIEQMNEALVERWNSVVKPGDTVYVLGVYVLVQSRDSNLCSGLSVWRDFPD